MGKVDPNLEEANIEALSEWLNTQMNLRNMSQRELGRNLGWSHSVVSKILGGGTPSLSFYLSAARFFNAMPDVLQLLGFISNIEHEDVFLRSLFNNIENLGPEEQQQVEFFVDFLTYRKQCTEAALKDGE